MNVNYCYFIQFFSVSNNSGKPIPKAEPNSQNALKQEHRSLTSSVSNFVKTYGLFFALVPKGLIHMDSSRFKIFEGKDYSDRIRNDFPSGVR